MKQILEIGLHCGCLRLEDCVIVMEMGCQQPDADERCDQPNAPVTEH